MTREEAIKMMKAKLECMTREISGHWENCNHKCDECNLCYEQGTFGEQIEWLKMAINALERVPCEDCISRKALLEEVENGIKAGNYEEGYEEYAHINDMDDIIECIKYADSVQPKAEQDPCEDAISRQAVFEQINCWIGSGEYRYTNATNYLIERVKHISSAKPQEPKTGHWITQWNVVHQKEYYYCSECREEFSYDGETGIKINDYDFCPNCGAKMESEGINV